MLEILEDASPFLRGSHLLVFEHGNDLVDGRPHDFSHCRLVVLRARRAAGTDEEYEGETDGEGRARHGEVLSIDRGLLLDQLVSILLVFSLFTPTIYVLINQSYAMGLELQQCPAKRVTKPCMHGSKVMLRDTMA